MHYKTNIVQIYLKKHKKFKTTISVFTKCKMVKRRNLLYLHPHFNFYNPLAELNWNDKHK